MTQTGNASTADRILAWLAAQPCPECSARKQLPAQAYVGGATGKVDCRECGGLGLAFPWASGPCPRKPTLHGHQGCSSCSNGCARVPKGLGLAELLSHASSQEDFVDIMVAIRVERFRVVKEGGSPDYTLAALRAIAAQAGMPCAS